MASFLDYFKYHVIVQVIWFAIICWIFTHFTSKIGVCMCFSRVWLFATPWTVARQVPLSMGFSRQEYWSGLPCLDSEELYTCSLSIYHDFALFFAHPAKQSISLQPRNQGSERLVNAEHEWTKEPPSINLSWAIVSHYEWLQVAALTLLIRHLNLSQQVELGKKGISDAKTWHYNAHFDGIPKII